MAHGKDYVPRRDGDFDRFFKRINQTAVSKTTGANPLWYHIPAAAVTELSASYGRWYTAYSATFNNPASPVIREKNRVRTAEEKILRRFVQRYLKDDPVSDEERDDLEIPNRDTTPSPIGDPAEHVLLLIEPKHVREHYLVWEVEENGSKAVPYGYSGVVLVRKILEPGEPVPTDPEALGGSRLLTKNYVTLAYPPGDQGKRCAYAACWQNESGGMGHWSSIVVVTIP
ncbi:MAG: hypothetical protein LBQ55_04135 [Treponema sp.]|jgi:hypothetical protein|nr:hypothetical protein [Treponema sp.]